MINADQVVARQMDRSGKVAGAYRRLEVLRQARQLEAAVPELPTGPFQVIVADPPWRYESLNYFRDIMMMMKELQAMSGGEFSNENAILWLCTTNAHLRVAFEVVESWGFEYKTLLTWVKDRMGTGEWLRGKTEHCLLATRGKPVFLHGNQTTVLEATRREHSRKPEEFYLLVDETSPGRKVELFSRQRRSGWAVFGNHTDQFDGPKAELCDESVES
jgi:N6-adenosine-specific RNA methylase IME4